MNRFFSLSRPFLVVFLAAGVTVVAIAQTAPMLDVRPGWWEATITSSIDLGGVPPMDPAEMTPAQREKLAEAMIEMAKPHTDTDKKCLTTNDIATLFLPETDETCKQVINANSKTLFDSKRTCTGDRTETAEVHLEAASRESVKGSFKGSVTEDGHTQVMSVTFTAQLLAADCGNEK